MSLNNTYFETKGRDITNPIPETPSYVPPVVPTPTQPTPGTTPVIPRPTHTGTITVTFYDNASDNNVLNKSLTQLSEKTISVKGDMNLIRPEFVINGTIDCNYMHMLGRYYYITCTAMSGEITKISGKSDPLMSFKSQIKNQTAIIDRNSSNYNTYLPDPERKITAYKTSHALKFSGSFSKTLYHYLLTTGNS